MYVYLKDIAFWDHTESMRISVFLSAYLVPLIFYMVLLITLFRFEQFLQKFHLQVEVLTIKKINPYIINLLKTVYKKY